MNWRKNKALVAEGVHEAFPKITVDEQLVMKICFHQKMCTFKIFVMKRFSSMNELIQ